MDNLDRFKEYSLYPSLYERIDAAFPEMEFRRKGSRWESTHHLNGDRDSQGKAVTYIYENSKFCIRDIARGEKPNLINFDMQRTGNDYITTVKRLAGVCGLTVPSADSEEWKKYEREQEDMAKAQEAFSSALWSGSDEAEEVLSYFHSRMWDDKEIKAVGIGLITPGLRESLPDGGRYGGWYQAGEKWIDGVKEGTHTVAIPYRSGSRILGFKFREPRAELKTGTKYTNTKGLAKSEGFFGIGVGVTDITIVEGELDALHARAKGARNIVATAGGAATRAQIEDAKKRGVKRFTLLFDNDERGKGFIAPTISLAEATGAEVYVAKLPEGQGKDVDEYLATHTIEEFNSIAKSADASYYYRTEELIYKYKDREAETGGTLTSKDREDFLAELSSILNAHNMNHERRDHLKRKLREIEHALPCSLDGFFEDADSEYHRRLSKSKAEEVGKASAMISEAVARGDMDGAVKIMEETSSSVGVQDQAPEFARVFAPSSPQELATFLSEVKDGIPTGFKFEQFSERESLTLNSGLTFICGYRGHGKTSFLNNIALNEAKRLHNMGSDKSVLYFSYEVDKRRLLLDLLNTFVNDKDISNYPLGTIQAYFKGKGCQYFKDGRDAKRRADGKTHYANFEEKKEIFFRQYLGNGRIVVVDENYKVGKLLDAIRYYVSSHNVSIVCIDYAQLIYSEDYSRQRTEEIKQVVNDIKDYANKSGIPFVLAAQFNREVESPVSVDTKNIGEGGDFERIADTCIGLFNLKELHPITRGGGEKEEKEVKKLLESLKAHTYEQGEGLAPIKGKLFVRLMKRRYGYYPLDTILEWEGKTKYIAPNALEELKAGYEQGTLFTEEQDDPSVDLVDEEGRRIPF